MTQKSEVRIANLSESHRRVTVRSLLLHGLMKAILLALLCSACSDSAPTICHGACEAPDGTACHGDCDCASGKCLAGSCKQPVSPAVSCGSDSECSGGTCVLTADRCEGHACATTEDCPALESCQGSTCVLQFCI
jgi:hypothetical protein